MTIALKNFFLLYSFYIRFLSKIGPLFIILFVYIILKTLKKKQEQESSDIKAYAENNGFESNVRIDLPKGLSLFSEGPYYAKNVLIDKTTGSFVFKYSYNDSPGYVSQTVFMHKMESITPKFSLVPYSKYYKPKAEIDIDHGFRQKFTLEGDDEKWIQKHFTKEAITYILNLQKEIFIESDGKAIIYYMHKKDMPISAIPAFIEEGNNLIKLLGVA